MSSTLDQEKAAAADTNTWIKLFKALQKIAAKQLLVLVVIAIISFPVASVLVYYINTYYPDFGKALTDTFTGVGLFMLVYTFTYIGFYFTYLVLSAVQTIVASKSSGS